MPAAHTHPGRCDSYGSVTNAPSDPDFIDLTVGYAHSCGLHVDGSVTCWGAGLETVIGEHVLQSVPPTTSRDVFTEISASDYTTCGKRTDGSVTCWGYDSAGQKLVTTSCGDVLWRNELMRSYRSAATPK